VVRDERFAVIKSWMHDEESRTSCVYFSLESLFAFDEGLGLIGNS
jgi:hypothetical protein